MDSLDLLAREDEFKKLNKQLEKKTESLMKEIEQVMQKQDIFSEFSHSLTITPHSTPKRHHHPPQDIPITPPKPNKRKTPKPNVQTRKIELYCDTSDRGVRGVEGDETSDRCDRCCCDHMRRSGDEQFLQAFVSVGVQEKVFPQSFLKDNISVESICKFLSSKVKLMQEQIDKLQFDIDKKAVQCKSHMTQHAELEGERLSLLNKNNSLRAAASDAKAKCMALENRLTEKDRLHKEQRSQCDKLTCEMKKLKSELASVASRHSSQEETISNLTQQLKAVKAEHLEFRDSTRLLSTSHQQTIATLESRIKALTATTDKQTQLIDNLRRQNAILSAEGALAITEKNYWDFLNEG